MADILHFPTPLQPPSEPHHQSPSSPGLTRGSPTGDPPAPYFGDAAYAICRMHCAAHKALGTPCTPPGQPGARPCRYADFGAAVVTLDAVATRLGRDDVAAAILLAAGLDARAAAGALHALAHHLRQGGRAAPTDPYGLPPEGQDPQGGGAA